MATIHQSAAELNSDQQVTKANKGASKSSASAFESAIPDTQLPGDQPFTPTSAAPPGATGRASPVSFPLGPPSTVGSTTASYSQLLDTHGSAQLDAAFAAQPAVPEDDVLDVLDGSPVSAPPPPPLPPLTSAAPLSPSPPPATPVDSGSAAPGDSFAGFLEQPVPQASDPASANAQSDAVASADPAGVYGVYDPSGAVDYLNEPAVQPPPTDEQLYEFATAVAASYVLDASLAQAVAEEALQQVAAFGSVAAVPLSDDTTGDVLAAENAAAETAAALLLLSSLQTADPDTTSADSAAAAAAAAPEPNAADRMVAPSPASPSAAGVAGSAAGEPEWRPYSSLPARYKTTVEALRSLASARFMEQHWDAAEHLDLEVTWDVPPIWLQGREAMRVAVWLAKWAATVELNPIMVKYEEVDSQRTRVELFLEARVLPHRPWWLPATWLLPHHIAVKATVKLRISKGRAADGSQDVVTLIDGAIHNLPKLPTPIRLLNGLFMGYMPAATEAFWAPLAGLLGDPSYRNRAEEHPTIVHKVTTAAQAAATAAADRTHDALTGAADSAKGAVTSAADTAAAAADKAAGAVGSVTAGAGEQGGVLGGVKGAVAGAVSTVRDVVQDAAGAVKEGAAVGAEKVAEVAGKARQAVSSLA